MQNTEDVHHTKKHRHIHKNANHNTHTKKIQKYQTYLKQRVPQLAVLVDGTAGVDGEGEGEGVHPPARPPTRGGRGV